MKIFKGANTKYKYRLLISYFLVVAITLIIMTGVLYSIFADHLQKEIEFSNQYKLNQLKNNFELRIKEIENLAKRLNVDNKLSPYSMGGSEYRRIEGLNQIGMYRAQNAFIDNYHLYIKNTGNVYSIDGQRSLSTLATNSYKLSLQNKSKFIELVENMKISSFIGNEWFEKNNAQTVDFISYMIPISYGNSDPYGVAIFQIKKSTINNMFKDITGNVKGHFIIFNRNNDLILSQNRSFKISEDDINIIRDIKTDGVMHTILNNVKVSLVTDSSDMKGISFVLVIPKSQFFEKLLNIRILIIQALLIMLAFGIFLAIAFSKNTYRPINDLVQNITHKWMEFDELYINQNSLLYIEEFQKNRKFLSKTNKIDKMNELDKINETVNIAFKQNRHLKEQINMQVPFMREQFLTMLLRGEFLDESTIKNLIDNTKIVLDGYSFAVAMVDKVLTIEEYTSRRFKDKVLSVAEIKSEFKNIVYPVELIQDDALALIINLDIYETDNEGYLNFLHHLKQILEKTTNEKIIIGSGRLYKSIDKINRSFIEALAALEESKVKGKTEILLFDEISGYQKPTLWYPAEEQLKFVQSLKQGDITVALESLENIFRSIEKNQTSILILKYVCYDIVNLIIKSINEMKIDNLKYNIENLMKFSNIHELEKETRSVVLELCERIKERQNTKNIQLNNKILEYIKDNISNNNLSLESVADEFGFSIYYLSRFFKEYTNQTFTDYIINLRIEKSKELLLTTQMPIKEIVPRIGYTDLTYFMKRFKKNEGITPSQFRKLYRTVRSDNLI